MQHRLAFVIVFAITLYPTFVSGQSIVEISDTTTILGESFLYPVELLNNGSDVTGINFKISFDTLALRYEGLSESSTISDSVLSIDNGAEGMVQFSLASTYPIHSSGTIVNLEFSSIQSGDTFLKLSEYRINEEAIVQDAGESRIRVFGEGGNQPPFAVNIPDTLVLISGDTLRLSIDETVFADAEDAFDSLDIQVSVDPQVVFGTFDGASGLITVTTIDFVGFATLSIRVEDTNGGVFEESIILDIQMGVANEVDDPVMPLQFGLDQNYPNPFNPSTKIGFTVNHTGFTLLEVFNLQGQKVATLIKNRLNAGRHTIAFEASTLASGIYLYRLTSGNEVLTKKMLLIK